MACAGDEEIRALGTWEFMEPGEKTKWEGYLGDASVPLLPLSMGMTVKDWKMAERPGPWNLSFGNPFIKDE